MEIDSSESQETATKPETGTGFWAKLRRLLVFQFKLYVDALRDFLLSFLSFWAFLLDVILNKSGEDSHFERVLKLGRRSERAINLFNQHSPEEQEKHSVDGLIREVEDRIRKEKE